MKEADFEKWISNLPVLTEIADEDRGKIDELLASPGLPLLLGLLFGSRQAHYALLSRQRMGSADECWFAAVLQGKIQGIELIVQTVKELLIPQDVP